MDILYTTTLWLVFTECQYAYSVKKVGNVCSVFSLNIVII